MPRTTPIAALNWDSGMLMTKYRIVKKKLLLLHHISQLGENDLAKEVFNVQKKYIFPGLLTEMKPWVKILNLPNIFDVDHNISKNQFKRQVSNAIKNKCREKPMLIVI